MGTWGAGIFDSDLASDVRQAFRDRVANGADAAKATRGLLADWAAGFADPEDGPVLWLALAEAAWDVGRLTGDVKKRALAILRDGTALAPFEREASDLVPARRQELERLAKKLAKAQPAPRRVPRRKTRTTEVAQGDLFAWQLPSGDLALLWAVAISVDKGGTCPVLELLDWTGKEPPPLARCRKLAARRTRIAYDPWGRLPVRYWVPHLARRNDPGRRYRLVAEGFGPQREVEDRGMGGILEVERISRNAAEELGI